MKTSINFKEAKSDSEAHNFRSKKFGYVREDLTPDNEYWKSNTISDTLQNIQKYCKEKSGRKLQKNAMPIREAVVVIKKETTMNDMHQLSEKLKELLGIQVFQIAIHKDEGHYDRESNEWKPNFHAHFVAGWQDMETGKTLKHQGFHYSKMQDITAEVLGMERGKESGTVARLEAIDYKIKMKENELENLQNKIVSFEKTVNDPPIDANIEINLFGNYKKESVDSILANFHAQNKLFSAKISENESKYKKQDQTTNKLSDENTILNQKITHFEQMKILLLSNSELYQKEKEAFLKSLKLSIEKTIIFERRKYNNNDFKNIETLNKIMFAVIKGFSDKNKIPMSSILEVFKMKNNNLEFYNLLKNVEKQNMISDDRNPKLKQNLSKGKSR